MSSAYYDVNAKEQTSRELVRNGVQYSMPDQVARFANAQATKNPRVRATPHPRGINKHAFKRRGHTAPASHAHVPTRAPVETC